MREGSRQSRPDAKERIALRLRRLEGQVAGLQKMIEADRYCVDILTQLSAVRAALDQIGIGLFLRHMDSCLQGNGCGNPNQNGLAVEAQLDELKASLDQFLGTASASAESEITSETNYESEDAH